MSASLGEAVNFFEMLSLGCWPGAGGVQLYLSMCVGAPGMTSVIAAFMSVSAAEVFLGMRVLKPLVLPISIIFTSHFGWSAYSVVPNHLSGGWNLNSFLGIWTRWRVHCG